MPADLPLIEETWRALLPFVRVEQCAHCECLQAALVELRLSLDELPPGPERDALLATVGRAMQGGASHACLGCQPCNPGDILANFYRGQQAAAAGCACGDG